MLLEWPNLKNIQPNLKKIKTVLGEGPTDKQQMVITRPGHFDTTVETWCPIHKSSLSRHLQ